MRTVDLFAGAGGFSTGARMAGAKVVWAANHWKLAVQVHHANHPEATHLCQDLHQADWTKVPEHDLLLASPACQGHSTASQPGRKYRHDADRATAWAIVSAVECHMPKFLVVENVALFRKWVLFDLWCEALRRFGYHLEEHLLDAADFGVPQNRKRLFIVGTRGPRPLGLSFEKIPHVGSRSFLDLDGDGWSPIQRKGRSKNALARIARGRSRLGHSFLTQHVTNHPGRSLDRPIGTITTKDQWCVVRGREMRSLRVSEVSAAMGFPPGYELAGNRADKIKLLGNAVAPLVARDIVRKLMAA